MTKKYMVAIVQGILWGLALPALCGNLLAGLLFLGLVAVGAAVALAVLIYNMVEDY